MRSDGSLMLKETVDVVLISCRGLYGLSQVCSVGLWDSAFYVEGCRSLLFLDFVLERSWRNSE